MSKTQQKSGQVSPSEPPGASLHGRMRRGAVFLTMGSAASRCVRIVIQFALYFLLDPEDFGLYAMTLAFIEVFQTLCEFGVGLAVIQKQDMPESYPVTAFWLNLAVSALMLGVAWAGAPLLAAFYNNSAVTLVVRVSSLNFIVQSLRIIPMALLRKRLEFGRYALLDSGWQTATGVLTVMLAFAGARYWSLVVSPMATGLLFAPLWFRASGWRPSLTWEPRVMREVLAYSRFIVGSTILTLTIANAGFIIAGHFLGDQQSGIYKFAMANSSLIVANFAWQVANVAMSGFALKQADASKLRTAFTSVFDVLTASTLPFHVLLFALTPQVFEIFPDKWASAQPVFRVLLVMAAIRCVSAHLMHFFNATGRPDICFRYYAIIFVVCIPAMYLSCRFFDLLGLAWAVTIVGGGGSLVLFALTPRLLKWEPIPFVRLTLPFALASALAGIVALAAARVLTPLSLPPLVAFFAASAIGGACYPLALYVGARERMREMITLLVPERWRTSYLGFLMA